MTCLWLAVGFLVVGVRAEDFQVDVKCRSNFCLTGGEELACGDCANPAGLTCDPGSVCAAAAFDSSTSVCEAVGCYEIKCDHGSAIIEMKDVMRELLDVDAAAYNLLDGSSDTTCLSKPPLEGVCTATLVDCSDDSTIIGPFDVTVGCDGAMACDIVSECCPTGSFDCTSGNHCVAASAVPQCVSAADAGECYLLECEDGAGGDNTAYVQVGRALATASEGPWYVDEIAWDLLGEAACSLGETESCAVQAVSCIAYDVTCMDFAEDICDAGEEIDCGECESIPTGCQAAVGDYPDGGSVFCYAASENEEECGQCARMEVDDKAVFIKFVHHDATLTDAIRLDINAYASLELTCDADTSLDNVRLYPVLCGVETSVTCADFETDSDYCNSGVGDLDCGDCTAIPVGCGATEGEEPDTDSSFCYASSGDYPCGDCYRMEVEDGDGTISSAVFIQFVKVDDNLQNAVELDVNGYTALGEDCADTLTDTVHLYPVTCPVEEPTYEVACVDFEADHCSNGALECGDCNAIPMDCPATAGETPDELSSFCYASSHASDFPCGDCARIEVDDEAKTINAIFVQFVHTHTNIGEIHLDTNGYESLGEIGCPSRVTGTTRAYPVACTAVGDTTTTTPRTTSSSTTTRPPDVPPPATDPPPSEPDVLQPGDVRPGVFEEYFPKPECTPLQMCGYFVTADDVDLNSECGGLDTGYPCIASLIANRRSLFRTREPEDSLTEEDKEDYDYAQASCGACYGVASTGSNNLGATTILVQIVDIVQDAELPMSDLDGNGNPTDIALEVGQAAMAKLCPVLCIYEDESEACMDFNKVETQCFDKGGHLPPSRMTNGGCMPGRYNSSSLASVQSNWAIYKSPCTGDNFDKSASWRIASAFAVLIALALFGV